MLKNILKKLSFIFIFCSVLLNGATFNEKIANIIGYDTFNENLSLINYIFQDKSAYYQNQSLNYPAVMQRLKDNGLLTVSLNAPENITISFKISNAPIKSMKIISDSLKRLGYYHYFTKSLVYNEDRSATWIINLKTEAAIDPLMLSIELAQSNCKFIDIKKEGYTKWSYVIDTSNSTLAKSQKLIAGEKVDLRKPLKPYFINFEEASDLIVLSKPGNQWFPNIVFYDKDLNILEIVKDDKKSRSIKLAIPEDTKYVKIDDIYTLENIKRGLSVMIK